MTDVSYDKIVAQELAALARETEALVKIKNAMGTSGYSKLVFDKVIKNKQQHQYNEESVLRSRNLLYVGIQI
jgi:hypothetical protein